MSPLDLWPTLAGLAASAWHALSWLGLAKAAVELLKVLAERDKEKEAEK